MENTLTNVSVNFFSKGVLKLPEYQIGNMSAYEYKFRNATIYSIAVSCRSVRFLLLLLLLLVTELVFWGVVCLLMCVLCAFSWL